MASYAGEAHSIDTDFLDLCLRNIGNDVGRQISSRIVNLVKQLFLDRVLIDNAAGSRGLADRADAVFVDLRDRIAEPVEARHILDARVGVIAASNLGAALEQMPGHRGARHRSQSSLRQP